MELDSYISFYKGISVFLTCMYENHHCNVFFFCLWMFTVHVICFAIEQYKNKQTREASLVMYKLFNKKKKFIHDCTELFFYKSLFYEMFVRVFCHVQYLLLRKKTGTKNNFFFYYKWSLACDITQLLTIKWKILFPRKKKTTSGMFMYWVHLPSVLCTLCEGKNSESQLPLTLKILQVSGNQWSVTQGQ